jgi:excisionase family DNA binding protein
METEFHRGSSQSGDLGAGHAARLTMTVDEVAKRLGISRPSAYEGVRVGQIPSVRIGRRLLIPVAALERMFDGAVSK